LDFSAPNSSIGKVAGPALPARLRVVAGIGELATIFFFGVVKLSLKKILEINSPEIKIQRYKIEHEPVVFYLPKRIQE